MMPLTLANVGDNYTIVKISGNSELKSHLETMGLVSGSVVTLVSSNKGNIIASVKGTRIAVSKEMASRIMI